MISYPVRINKYLTLANFCSRREADKLINERKVLINNVPAKLGQMINLDDHVEVRGKTVYLKSQPVYVAYNKPIGVICTTDRTKKDNILEAINYPTRVYPIGRLDVNSCGLILLTNDGSIVNKILKSDGKIEKEYYVRIDQEFKKEDLPKLAKGVYIDGYKTKPAKVFLKSPNAIHLTLVEGKNRQIRKMMESLGYTVNLLQRVRIGRIKLGGLKRGEYREIDPSMIV